MSSRHLLTQLLPEPEEPRHDDEALGDAPGDSGGGCRRRRRALVAQFAPRPRRARSWRSPRRPAARTPWRRRSPATSGARCARRSRSGARGCGPKPREGAAAAARARGSCRTRPSRPSRSYFLVGSQRCSSMTSSIGLRRAHRRDAEEVLDVDDPDAAQLHVVADHLRRAARRARRSGSGGSRRRRRRRGGAPGARGRARTRSCRCPTRPEAGRPCRRRRRGRRGASLTGPASPRGRG